MGVTPRSAFGMHYFSKLATLVNLPGFIVKCVYALIEPEIKLALALRIVTMKTLLVLISAWLFSRPLLAQDSSIIKIKNGVDIAKALPKRQQYQYPEFITGKVWYNTGNSAAGRLNYNLLLGEMHFIQPTGDTLSLADEYTIKYITIQADTFYYDAKKGYLQVIAHFNPVKLAVKQKLRKLSDNKVGAYEQATAVSSIRQYSYYTDRNGQIRNLTPKGDLLLTKAESFFLLIRIIGFMSPIKLAS